LTGWRVASVGEARPAFLIPYFTMRGVNGVFAQELDRNLRIKEFRSFQPGHYDQISFIPPPISRKAGEYGLLAFLNGAGRVSFGKPEKLKKKLARARTNPEAVFFNLQASLFVGDPVRLANAISLASASLSDPEIRKIWTKVEEAVQNKKLGRSAGSDPATDTFASLPNTRPIPEITVHSPSHGVAKQEIPKPPTVDPIEFLALNPQKADWVQEWIGFWDKRADRDRLFQIALNWLAPEARRRPRCSSGIAKIAKPTGSKL
jgi:hypothetical protein